MKEVIIDGWRVTQRDADNFINMSKMWGVDVDDFFDEVGLTVQGIDEFTDKDENENTWFHPDLFKVWTDLKFQKNYNRKVERDYYNGDYGDIGSGE
jgi:hypothetical protein